MPNNINGAKYRNAPPRVIERVLAAEREITDEGCWLWLGKVSHDGYAFTSYRHQGKRPNVYVHRLVFMYFKGDPGDAAEVDHACHKPEECTAPGDACVHRRCFNPDHLQALSPGDNLRRSAAPGGVNSRKTHCDENHPFDEANTYYPPSGGRTCLKCYRAWRRRQAAEKRSRTRERLGFCDRCGADISHRSPRAVYCELCTKAWIPARRRADVMAMSEQGRDRAA